MDPQKKPLTLKVNLPGGPSIAGATPSTGTPGAMSPPPQTPSAGGTKIKLVRKSLPPTPADPLPPSLSIKPALATESSGTPAPKIKTKTSKPPKPSIKKRAREDEDGGGDGKGANGVLSRPQPKKAKILLKGLTGGITKQPTLKVKSAGRIPHRPLGEGYDSEADDREPDPVIEEQFLLRMMPGEHCEYLRKAVAEKKIGIPKAQGGADIQMKIVDDEGRRMVITIQGQAYAAILVDLPTITEGMKTWDKKAMVKTADICQMLLVFAKVDNEEAAKTVPPPTAVEHGHRWPHGITPPMHDARNRRFRKRLSKLEIQNKEAEVDRLLAADKEAESTRWEFVDSHREDQQESGDEEQQGDEGDLDAEGEVDDYFGDADATQEGFDDSELFDENALEAEFLGADETPMEAEPPTPFGVGPEGVTPVTPSVATPAAAQTEESGGEADGADDEDEEEEDDEDVDDEGGDDDGDVDEHDQKAGVRNEIANLRRQLKSYEEQLAQMQQPIMRKRIEGSIRSIKSEIRLKQSSIGEVDED